MTKTPLKANAFSKISLICGGKDDDDDDDEHGDTVV